MKGGMLCTGLFGVLFPFYTIESAMAWTKKIVTKDRMLTHPFLFKKHESNE